MQGIALLEEGSRGNVTTATYTWLEDCPPDSGAPRKGLPKSVLLLSAAHRVQTPFRVLWDCGSTHCVLSPDAAARLGFVVPTQPVVGKGKMVPPPEVRAPSMVGHRPSECDPLNTC